MKSTGLLLTIILSSLSGCGVSAHSDNTLFVSGRIDGDTVDISAKRVGRVVEILVREGDSVEAGQLLAVLSSDQDVATLEQEQARVVSDQRTVEKLQREVATYGEKIREAQLFVEQAQTDAPGKVKEAEANLAAIRAELTRSEAELKQSQIDAERYSPLATRGAVAVQLAEQYVTKSKIAQATVDANRKKVAAAEANVQQAMSELQNPPIKESNRKALEQQVHVLKAQIAGAKADVDAAQAAVRHAQANVSDLKIVAPIAGTILTRSAEPGRVVDIGQTVLTMVDLHKLYLRGFIPQGTVGNVKVGQPANVYLDSAPKEAIPAEVIRIDPQLMFTPENTYFKEDRVKQVMGVKLGLRGGFGYAKPGMPADGEILIGRNDERSGRNEDR